jgi:hypothetical protein
MRTALALLTVIFLGCSTSCSPVQDATTIRVEEQVQTLLDLNTYEHIYRDLVYFGEERTFLFLKTMDRAVLFSIDIRVVAGLDLSEGFRITRDRLDAQRVYVQLPPATILSVDADEQSITEYFIRERGGRIGLLELSGQLEAVKQQTADEAIERGILTDAEENARRIITSFLEMAGFAEIEFAGPTQEREDDDAELRG